MHGNLCGKGRRVPCGDPLAQVESLMVVPQVQGLTVVTLLFAAVAGDVTALHRHYLQVSAGWRFRFTESDK